MLSGDATPAVIYFPPLQSIIISNRRRRRKEEDDETETHQSSELKPENSVVKVQMTQQSTRVAVPCGDGRTTLRDIAHAAAQRYKNATNKIH
ncbi:hypothetical protein PRIPAC_94230 [Pristionchus pacificus]|uniref:Par3_HAL_N_term domain-containing protein n=1 Tax=Pristionchus pacificus TaxID=54126 RepID=A0A2A6BB10_PRIPA|nr:hypothetical protein PRIPAC_94230 [Pristionchus pacificus]|eukprot:PDM63063.1 hypothetical protein PRIPAC_50278 [Pristionchus pacificus]